MCRDSMRLKSKPIGQSFMTIAGMYKDELSGQLLSSCTTCCQQEHQGSLVISLFQV